MSSEQRSTQAGTGGAGLMASGPTGDPDTESNYPAPLQADSETLSSLSLSDRRTAPRFMFQVPVTIQMGRGTGQGKVHDMSSTGARIEHANIKCAEGARVRLGFRFFKDSPPIELSGDVVRVTDTGGFCVHFGKLDPRTRRALTTLLPKVASGRCDEHSERTFSGELLTRLGPTLHRACAEAAHAAGIPLNDWIKEKLAASSKEDLERARTDDVPVRSQGPTRNPYQR